MAAGKKTVKKKTVSTARPAKKSSAKPVKSARGGAGKKAGTRKKIAKPAPAPKKPAKKPIAAKPKKTRTTKTPAPSNRLAELKKTLIKKREKIVREAKEEIAKYISGDHRQLVDTAVDEGDWAVVDISEDINLARLGAHRRALIEIDESLRKIAENTYGICEECGDEISEQRLRVLPTATLCITCQENKEQLEAIVKEEPV